MLNVGYDYQVFALQHVGGISRYVCELSQRVDTAVDFAATIVAPVHFNAYLREREAGVLGFYVPPVPRTGWLIRAFDAAVSRVVLRLLRPSVVHETYYSSAPLARRGTPIVLTVHDMVHERFAAEFRADDRTSAHKRAAVARADRIICISANTQKDLVELFGVSVSRTRVIHNGFGFRVPAAPAMTQRSIDGPFLLYVGHRGGWKNFAALVDAYAASRARDEFRLVVFGGGPFDAGERRRMRSLGLAERQVVHVAGGDAVLASLYRHAAVFVYPSRYEGFGIPPLEAMSFDCPVACSNASSIPEVVGDAARLFDPADVDSIRDAIEDVVGSAETRARLVARGRERVKRFSWDRCASETMALYRELAG